MTQDLTPQTQLAFDWFSQLRDRICSAFEQLEDEAAPLPHAPTAGRFVRRQWQRTPTDDSPIHSGGGISALMKGRLFEKVGVNVSCVSGEFTPEFAAKLPGTHTSRHFTATGISLVAHMHSPKVPAVHMNTRYICTEQSWFGGGFDLNPALPFDEDTADFHAAARDCCNRHNPAYHARFKQWCDEYFWIKHRNEARGVGGIFYDYLKPNTDDQTFESLMAFTQDVGETFLQIYSQLVRRRMHEAFTPQDKQTQLVKRSRYAEFNLLYDRGTAFGLQTGGDVEAILMSMPPHACWP